jgi:GNAT superfamily N-acetyltransferase
MPPSIRDYRPGDEKGAYHVCLKTGNHGADGEPFYREDPDCLGRIYVGPYLKFEPGLSLILEDDDGICGYALAAFDSRSFYDRYEHEWRPPLCASFPAPPEEDRQHWNRVQQVHYVYHHPEYFVPEPYDKYPSHLHIDLLQRAQRRGFGQQMMNILMDRLRDRGSPGVHLCMAADNHPAYKFYSALGFKELIRHGEGDEIYMSRRLT